MKTALILLGNIRTWTSCRDSFFKTFSYLNPDIYISTYNTQYNYHPYICGMLGNYSDNILSDNEIYDMFNDKTIKHIDINKISDFTVPETIHPRFREHLSTYHQANNLYNCVKTIIDVEVNNNIKYDLIIKTRFDLIYNPIDISTIPDSIIVDSGNVFPNDCILIASRDTFVSISEFIINELHEPKYSDSHLNPPHGLLECAINNLHIPIECRSMMAYVNRKGNYHHKY